ncbi:glycine cleavage system protein GcvH [Nocardia crassostreae]|uniref:glycine cleavage system protein GcvH n=1 Tax=Nocardia crassostreae TaxID=53428 RepID=UPI00082B2E05|nr:glycine cleavage system protein GcvH [Nocardia crassostreae]
MTTIPNDLRYTREHEWVRLESTRAAIGLTDFAQRQLGDCVYLQLPKIGDNFLADEPFGSVESVKAVTELYMPLTGTITATNDDLVESPEEINDDPYGSWMVQIAVTDTATAENLLTAEQYTAYIAEEATE